MVILPVAVVAASRDLTPPNSVHLGLPIAAQRDGRPLAACFTYV